ncbi:MAG TPA: DciA family protein [Methylophilaceae bacterium]|nr:DciA family protein [Methylophilaceae bacterium]
MRRISALFRENAELVVLSGQADSLSVSQKIWNATVPDSLKKYTQAGSVKHRRLTVYASNGAVAAKIKLLLPSLLTKLQKQGLEVTSIRVEVQVHSSRPKAPGIQRCISPQASSRLAQMAEQLEGTALGEVLSRLSSRSQK